MKKSVNIRPGVYQVLLAVPLSFAALLFMLLLLGASTCIFVVVLAPQFGALSALPPKQFFAIAVIVLITLACMILCAWGSLRTARRILQEAGVLAQTTEVLSRKEVAQMIDAFIAKHDPFDPETKSLLEQEFDDDPVLRHVLSDFARILDDYESYGSSEVPLRDEEVQHLRSLIAVLQAEQE
jgi:hypothetical protein